MKLLNRILDWMMLRWRHKSPAWLPISVGSGLIAIGFPNGWMLQLLAQHELFDASLGISKGADLPVVLQYLTFLIGLGMVVWGAFVVHKNHLDKLDKLTVIAVEQRGLRIQLSSRVDENIPPILRGNTQSIIIDHTPYVDDSGKVTDPVRSLQCVTSIRTEMESRVRHMDKQDVSIVYGGMASVPFTFLAGQLIDDENQTTVMDWDRGASRWRELDGDGQVNELNVSGLQEAIGNDEVAIGVAISYPLEAGAIQALLPDVALVTLSSEDFRPDNHWNVTQQSAWVTTITNVVRQLCDGRTKRLHLFIAAQNSVVFNIGRSFDNRLYPNTLIYQYERSTDVKYPWAVDIPNRDDKQASVVESHVQENSGQ